MHVSVVALAMSVQNCGLFVTTHLHPSTVRGGRLMSHSLSPSSAPVNLNQSDQRVQNKQNQGTTFLTDQGPSHNE